MNISESYVTLHLNSCISHSKISYTNKIFEYCDVINEPLFNSSDNKDTIEEPSLAVMFRVSAICHDTKVYKRLERKSKGQIMTLLIMSWIVF